MGPTGQNYVVHLKNILDAFMNGLIHQKDITKIPGSVHKAAIMMVPHMLAQGPGKCLTPVDGGNCFLVSLCFSSKYVNIYNDNVGSLCALMNDNGHLTKK